MDLDDRKKKILRAVVESYIDTAEPVGSRSISKLGDITLSPATIRNEMGDLEDMGLLEQPHTSAGRVPSDLGYRLYVDSIMRQYRMSVEEVRQMRMAMELKMEEIGSLVRHMSNAFAKISNMPTIATLPEIRRGVIRNLKLIKVDDRNIILVLVTDSGLIKNKQFRSGRDLSEGFLEKLTAVLNQNLAGRTLSEISLDNVLNIENGAGENYEVLMPVLGFVRDCIAEMDTAEVFMEGAANILNFPEYSDVGKARQMLTFLEDKDNFGDVLEVGRTEGGSIKIIIGKENLSPQLRDSSIIISNYTAGNNIAGCIGIIGPTRMDYPKVITKLKFFTDRLSRMLTREFGDGET